MFGADAAAAVVEVFEIAALHVDRAHAQSHRPVVQAVEVDQLEQGPAQRLGVVEAGTAARQRRESVRAKEARQSEGGAPCSRAVVAPGPQRPRGQGQHGRRDAAADHVPEGPETVNPVFRRIAGHECGVDGADGNAGNPLRLVPGRSQRLEGAALIGAEGAAPLQDQHVHGLRLRGAGWF